MGSGGDGCATRDLARGRTAGRNVEPRAIPVGEVQRAELSQRREPKLLPAVAAGNGLLFLRRRGPPSRGMYWTTWDEALGRRGLPAISTRSVSGRSRVSG